MSWILAIAELVYYSIIILPAGHGAVPLGALFVYGDWSVWGVPLTFAYVAIGLELFSLFPYRKNVAVVFRVLASIMLCSSVLLFIYYADNHYAVVWTPLLMIPLIAIGGLKNHEIVRILIGWIIRNS